MEGKPTSPRRPRGPGSPINPSVAEEHGHAETSGLFGGSSRSSLFGLFRRQPSRSSLRSSSQQAPTRSGQSLRSTGGESFSQAFDNMSFNVSEAGLESPQQAQETARRMDRMLKAAEGYRTAIEAMSEAAAEFGDSLYECADTKGASAGRTQLPDQFVGADLQAAGGLHLLISNHANVLASSLRAQIEGPVRKEYIEYKKRLENKELQFKTALRSKMSALRQADTHRKDPRKRGVNLLAYRNTLLDLTSQIDDINRLKFEFLSDIHALSTELAESLHSSIASTVTAEIEVFEGIARKGWSGGGLDGLLAGCPDPFDPGQAGTSHRSSISSTVALNGTVNGEAGSSHGGRYNNEESGDQDGYEFEDDDMHITNTNNNNNNNNGSGGGGYATSSSSSSKSPNLFSVIPPGPILPRDRSDDEASERSKRTHSRTSSDISEIADLTLTPSRARMHEQEE